MLKITSAIILVMSFVSVANAGYEKRQKLQNQRIEKKVTSGKINESEAQRLENGQVKVDQRVERLEATKEAAKSDGVVTRSEKKQLVRQRASVKKTQNRQSERIKTNNQNKK
jgi:hypothetical protein